MKFQKQVKPILSPETKGRGERRRDDPISKILISARKHSFEILIEDQRQCKASDILADLSCCAGNTGLSKERSVVGGVEGKKGICMEACAERGKCTRTDRGGWHVTRRLTRNRFHGTHEQFRVRRAAIPRIDFQSALIAGAR